MKKRDLILDFTSLLDVIMIILFLVLGSMNQAAEKTNEDAKAEMETAIAEAESARAGMEDAVAKAESAEKGKLEAEKKAELEKQEKDQLAETLESLQNEHESLSEQYESLNEQYDSLEADYDYLKVITDFEGTDQSVYEKTVEKISHILLVCRTGKINTDGNQEIILDLYLENKETKEQKLEKSMTLVHKKSSTKEEREKLEASQIVDATRFLAESLKEETSPLIWFSVQYDYDDEKVAYTDLNIIRQAADNLERIYGKACYLEEVRMKK